MMHSSLEQIEYDQSRLFSNGYIIVKYNIKEKIKFAEVWVTPVDNPFPSECLCYLKNKYCVACRTATTTCEVNNDIVNKTGQPGNNVAQEKSDLIAWVSVGSILGCACICALIIFQRHRSCSGIIMCNSYGSNQPDESLNNECLPGMIITARSGSTSAIASIDNIELSLPLVDSYDESKRKIDDNEISLTSVESYKENELQADNYVTDKYFHFLPPESSSENLSKTVSEQMLDINRDFFISNNSGSENDEENILSETISVENSDIND